MSPSTDAVSSSWSCWYDLYESTCTSFDRFWCHLPVRRACITACRVGSTSVSRRTCSMAIALGTELVVT